MGRSDDEWRDLMADLRAARAAFLKACFDGQTRDTIRKAAAELRRCAYRAGVQIPRRDDLEGYSGKVSDLTLEDRRPYRRHNTHDD